MRYPASEKLEIIRLVEQSHLPAKQTLDMLGVPRTTFYRWYAHYRLDGEAALQDKAPLPARVWNRIPDSVRERLIRIKKRPSRNVIFTISCMPTNMKMMSKTLL